MSLTPTPTWTSVTWRRCTARQLTTATPGRWSRPCPSGKVGGPSDEVGGLLDKVGGLLGKLGDLLKLPRC